MKPISKQTKRKMIDEVGLAALYLYEHYVECLGRKSHVLNDKQVAAEIGLSEQVVKRNRLRLTKANYFFEIKTASKFSVNHYYALGREAVMRVKYYDRIFDLQTAFEIRKEFTMDQAARMIDMSDVPGIDKLDIIDSLLPKGVDAKKAPATWA